MSQSPRQLSLEEATPFGVANAIEAMVDDVLLAYASAQLMINNQTENTNVTTTSAAMRVDKDVYIRAIFGINIFICLLMVVEAVRTRLWYKVSSFDYMDPADVILGASQKKEGLPSDHMDLDARWQEKGYSVALIGGRMLDVVYNKQ
jgi:hypothetical protein